MNSNKALDRLLHWGPFVVVGLINGAAISTPSLSVVFVFIITNFVGALFYSLYLDNFVMPDNIGEFIGNALGDLLRFTIISSLIMVPAAALTFVLYRL